MSVSFSSILNFAGVGRPPSDPPHITKGWFFDPLIIERSDRVWILRLLKGAGAAPISLPPSSYTYEPNEILKFCADWLPPLSFAHYNRTNACVWGNLYVPAIISPRIFILVLDLIKSSESIESCLTMQCTMSVARLDNTKVGPNISQSV